MNNRGFIWHKGQLICASCLAIGLTLRAEVIGFAQTIPDATLGKESSVITPNVIINDIQSDRIDGGAIRGANLFHSFQDFNVGEGRGVYFANPAGIQNILSRVTGSKISQILGTLGVLGNADLFLINPNGIIFGPNARLDLNGSFIGSTASALKLADGSEFSATNPQAPSLLTINVPIGLQYGPNPGKIVNQSVASITEEDGSEVILGLQVQPEKTLALVGGNVSLEGGYLTAPEGRIELASVGDNSFVSLTPHDRAWALGYQGVQNFQDISLSRGAIVDASGEGGGDIQITARRLSLTDDSQIFSVTSGDRNGGTIAIAASESVEINGNSTSLSTDTQGTGSGGYVSIETGKLTALGGGYIATNTSGEGRAGDLTIKASESVELIGTTSDGTLPTGLFAQVFASGSGGNLTVETRRLLIRDGATIGTTTFDTGHAGNLTVRASESVQMIGTAANPLVAGGIASGVEAGASGNSGNLTIETKNLTIQGGGQIATASRGDGDAGILTVNASEAIALSGASPSADLIRGSSGFFASAEEGSTGKVGNLDITTRQLSISNGARISADNFGPKSGGNLTVNVGQLSIRNGGTLRAGSFGEGSGGSLTVNASESVEVSGSGTLGGQPIISSLFARSEGSGNAGELTIKTGEFRVANGALVTVSSRGTGGAGSMNVNANSIRLDNAGKLAADSTAGLGNITLQTSNLILRGNSSISTNSRGDDPGGNLTINTENLVALENSDITANATNSFGGQVTISATGIFGTEFRSQQSSVTSDITATSDLGTQFSGTVKINTPDVDPSKGLLTLSLDVVDLTNLIASGCANYQGSSFVVTGRGGIPPSPNDPLIGDGVLVDIGAAIAEGEREQGTEYREQDSQQSSLPTQIVEAQGWVIDSNGKVILTANVPTLTLSSSGINSPQCQPR